MASNGLRIRIIQSLGEVEASAWDACAMSGFVAELDSVREPLDPKSQRSASSQRSAFAPDSTPQGHGHNPFISHAFLSALERSGSATAKTGWLGQHLLAKTEDGCLVGAVPCYLKSHSRGEYVFDHGWADAYERAGGRYYPKLQVAVPFTPVTGPRLLVSEGADPASVRPVLLEGLLELCRLRGASSVHITFPTEAEWDLFGAQGLLQRMDQQFHWLNQGYDAFDHFLGALTARKRKTIARERREALAPGISVDWLTGSDLTEAVWDAFFAFYMDTGSRKWGRPYLTRPFFSMIGETMPERILLVMAKRAGRYIAGAINFVGSDALYGRHWGAIEHHPFLHFEVCYYQAIEFAIARKLARVEAGAQGEHKVARGYRPVPTYSAHHIADPALRRAIAQYLARERLYVDSATEELAAAAPFKRA